MWFVLTRWQHQIQDDSMIMVLGLDIILPVWSVRHLGIYHDSDLSMLTQVSCISTLYPAASVLRRIRRISRSVSFDRAVAHRDAAGPVTFGLRLRDACLSTCVKLAIK